jgi:uncharacterized membrane protein YccC
VLAIPAIAVVGAAAGYCFSVSLRLSIAGLSIALSMVIAQGLPLDASDALGALLLSTAGGLMQPLFSILAWAARDRAEEGEAEAWSTSAARARLRGNLTLVSVNARHALRFGTALAAGVAAYWLLDMEDHGFWIPLTILFVLRPRRDETFRRLVLRAVGTAAGLIVASLLSEWLQGDAIALALVLTLATGLAYGLLTVQYALFTMAITVYAVVLADTLGEPTLEAAGQRGLATAIGIAIAFLSFLVWSNPAESQPRRANR